MTTPTPELLQAFKETDYILHSEPPFAMRIGQACPELMTLMAQHKAQSAAFITAWNPWSQALPDAENEARQNTLKAQLSQRGLPFVDGIGQHPSNNWPGEPSVLILGLDREAAKALAKAHEQHAFVWVGSDGVAELVWPQHSDTTDQQPLYTQ